MNHGEIVDREVKPHVLDAWIDTTRRDPKDCEAGMIGYECASIAANSVRTELPSCNLLPDADKIDLRDAAPAIQGAVFGGPEKILSGAKVR